MSGQWCPVCGGVTGPYRLGTCSPACDRTLGDETDLVVGVLTLVIIGVVAVIFVGLVWS